MTHDADSGVIVGQAEGDAAGDPPSALPAGGEAADPGDGCDADDEALAPQPAATMVNIAMAVSILVPDRMTHRCYAFLDAQLTSDPGNCFG